MSKTETYSGTSGLTIEIAILRLFQLLDKEPLSTKDKDFYLESKQLIEKELKDILKESRAFSSIKDLLTNKQWQRVFDLN